MLGYLKLSKRRHAAGHPHLAGRQGVLRRRHAWPTAFSWSTATVSSEIGFIPTGIGTHGLYPSRDGTQLYVANRGSHRIRGGPRGQGSVRSSISPRRKVDATWPIPGGGSPDMGNVSADGKTLWLSGRFDNVVYVIDTTTGAVKTIPVGQEPHGLTVWPQPGRYSLGHTGNMR